MSVSQIFRRFPPPRAATRSWIRQIPHSKCLSHSKETQRREREREILASLSNPDPVVVLKAKKSPGCVFNTFPPPFLVRATSGVAPPPPNDDRRRRRRRRGTGKRERRRKGVQRQCVSHIRPRLAASCVNSPEEDGHWPYQRRDSPYSSVMYFSLASFSEMLVRETSNFG